MHRLGFQDKDLKELLALLKAAPHMEIVSIYSHLAGADEATHNAFSKSQFVSFTEMAQVLERSLNIKPIKHILNSAGMIRFPEYQLDMVRLGIGLYGFEATRQEQGQLQPISTLKTVISQLREVKKGETIGYGRKGLVKQDSKIATIAIGYADGFSRAFGNGKISLLVNGKAAPVIGNVCMDMTMLDVTGINAHEGDEVIVFGERPTIMELAEAIGTIPYEILTNISSRVTRVFYSG
jgi:alanine racemase